MAPDTGPDASRRLLDAILSVSSDLSLPAVLRRIVESACDLVAARYGALGVLDEHGERLSEFITVGIDAEQAAQIGPLPEGRGILGHLIVHPRPIRIRDLTAHPDSYGFPAGHPPMHSFLGVPIRSRNAVFGNLYLTEKIGGPEFTPEDEELVIGLAGAAGVAIENARLHARVREYAVLEDRERIARDLHDTVIQRLYATGLSLSATQRMAVSPKIVTRLQQALADLDDTIRDIRSTIFSLQTVDRGAEGLRADVLRLSQRSENSLGFAPSVAFDGLVDTGVPDGIGDHLLAALREALTNVAKHARAARAWVRVEVDDAQVRLTVADDGQGLPADRGSGSGLRNLVDRATALGGSCDIAPRPGGGTEVVWQVPRSAP